MVAANNRYDQAYVEHFTGVRPLYLPTLAGYVTARYRGGGARERGRPFLLWRAHHEMGRTLLAELGRTAPDVAIRSLDTVYPGGAGRGGYQFSDLARHPGARGALSASDHFRAAHPPRGTLHSPSVISSVRLCPVRPHPFTCGLPLQAPHLILPLGPPVL